MEFRPDGRHPTDGAGEPKDKDQVKAQIGQIGLRSADHDDLGVGHACLLDLELNVFHSTGLMSRARTVPPSATILAAETVKKPGPQPSSRTV
jgi:hypothetical protein